MRFWDVHVPDVPLAEVFTGHKMGETVAALALSPDNSYAVTGDSAGFIKVSCLLACWTWHVLTYI